MNSKGKTYKTSESNGFKPGESPSPVQPVSFVLDHRCPKCSAAVCQGPQRQSGESTRVRCSNRYQPNSTDINSNGTVALPPILQGVHCVAKFPVPWFRCVCGDQEANQKELTSRLVAFVDVVQLRKMWMINAYHSTAKA